MVFEYIELGGGVRTKLVVSGSRCKLMGLNKLTRYFLLSSIFARPNINEIEQNPAACETSRKFFNVRDAGYNS
jgi:hypothetical protein